MRKKLSVFGKEQQGFGEPQAVDGAASGANRLDRESLGAGYLFAGTDHRHRSGGIHQLARGRGDTARPLQQDLGDLPQGKKFGGGAAGGE